MPRADNEVIGTIECDRCQGECSILRTKRGKGSNLYTRCTNCAADQRTGKYINAHLLKNGDYRDGVNLDGLLLPENFEPNSGAQADYEPAIESDENAVNEPEKPSSDAGEAVVSDGDRRAAQIGAEPESEPESEPGKPKKTKAVGLLALFGSLVGMLWLSNRKRNLNGGEVSE